MDKLRERYSLPPTSALKFRAIGKFASLAYAEIRHGHDVMRQSQNRCQLLWVQDADPTHTDTFRAAGEP